MLNNLNHVRKCLQDDNIQSILAEQNDQLSNFYKNEVIDYQSKYLRSWTKVTSIFASLEFSQDKKSIKNCITVSFFCFKKNNFNVVIFFRNLTMNLIQLLKYRKIIAFLIF